MSSWRSSSFDGHAWALKRIGGRPGRCEVGQLAASAYRHTIRRGSARRKMELVQISPPPRRVFIQGDTSAFRRHRGTLVEAQLQCLCYLVSFGGTSVRASKVWDNALMFACIRMKSGEGFSNRSRHRDSRRTAPQVQARGRLSPEICQPSPARRRTLGFAPRRVAPSPTRT